jgi:hypothetical protein
MCSSANWSRPSNITSYSCAPDRATEEQAKQPNTCGESQAPNYPIGAPGKKTLDIRPMLQVCHYRVCPQEK